ncbi:MAG: hypothetical protein IJC39_02270, partial [Firmicutes bacterium]|nr:hypothetical protein [Bacillota bacterium]
MEDYFGIITPAVDTRKKEELFKQMTDLVRSYTPEWNPEDSETDPGMAMMRLLSEIYAESVNKINHLYGRHKILYLNKLGANMLTSVPARGVVVFESGNEYGGAIVPKGSVVLAEVGEGSIAFETQTEIFVSGTYIKGIYEASRDSGKILCIYSDVPKELTEEEKAEAMAESEFDLPYDEFELFEFEEK